MNQNRLIVLAALSLVASLAGCCTSNDILGGAQPQVAEFTYVSNENSNNVNAYSVTLSTGALTPVTGSPYDGDTGPRGVAVDPTQRFLYMANESSNDVSAYTIDATTGALTPITGSPFPVGTCNEDAGVSGVHALGTTSGPSACGPRGVAVDPSGKYLYVANELSDNVSGFTIDSTTGALTLMADSPFASTSMNGSTGPRGVAVDPSDKYVYVTNHTSDDVSGYSINATTGELTPLSGSPFPAEETPFDVVVEPSDRYVYVTNHLSGNVSAYALTAGTGALTPITGSPFPAGSEPHGIVVDPSGTYVYVANHASDNVSAYSIDSGTGALTDLTGSPFADTSTGGTTAPYGLAVDPSGKYVYVANNGSDDVAIYTITAETGVLTQMGTTGAGTGPHGVAIAAPPQ